MLTVADRWRPVGPQSVCLTKDVFRDKELVARIVDTTADIYLTSDPCVCLYEADLLFDQVWEADAQRFTDEASALRSIKQRLDAKR